MGLRSDIEIQIDRGINLKWSSAAEIEKYVSTLSQTVSQFQESARVASEALIRLEAHVETLRSCAFSPSQLNSEMDALNAIMPSLSFGYLSDLKVFIASFNTEIEAILLKRLTDALKAFSSRVENPTSDSMLSLFLSSDFTKFLIQI